MLNLSGLWNEIADSAAADRLALGEMRLLETGVQVSEGEILVGIDSQDCRHVIVPVPQESPEQSDSDSQLKVKIRRYVTPHDEQSFCDISCSDAELNDIFSTVAEDMVDELLRDDRNAAVFSSCVRVLERWRKLLSRLPIKMMSRQKQAGLIAELLVLLDLVEHSVLAITQWAGPDGGDHDFVSETVDLEVKSSMRKEGRRAHVQSLEQLSASDNHDLYLHFVSLNEPVGDGYTIPSLVDRLLTMGVNGYDLHEKLSAAGYSPTSRTDYMKSRFEVRERLTFPVTGSKFPRLTRSELGGDIPVGVLGVNYDIDLDTCAEAALSEAEVRSLLERMARA